MDIDIDSLLGKYNAVKSKSANAGMGLYNHVGRNLGKYAIGAGVALTAATSAISAVKDTSYLFATPKEQQQRKLDHYSGTGFGKMAITTGFLGGLGYMAAGAYRSLNGKSTPGTGAMWNMAKGVGNTLGKASNKLVNPMADSAANIVKSQGDSWMRKGMMPTLGKGLGLGMAFGGLTAAFDLALNAPTDQEAMMRSQEGSAYSSTGGFGTRRPSTIKDLGRSTIGLVAGLHRSRHG